MPPLFAEVVFDRPLDHAYSYAVPDEFCERIAIGQRVSCSFGRGEKSTVGYVVGLNELPPARDVKPINSILDDVPLIDATLLELTRWMADHYLCGWGQVLHAVVPAGVRDRAGTRNVAFVEAVAGDDLPKLLPGTTPKQKAILDLLRSHGEPLELAELQKLGASAAIIAGLAAKGLVRKFSKRIEKLPSEFAEADAAPPSPPLAMNADQAAAWGPILAAVEEGGFHPFLLHGVTGSGKTEVYLRAIERTVQLGREAIVLVPEISLTPQTIARFRGRCGRVAVLHSHLTDAERASYWRHVAAGRVQVVVGARSAVFAPTRNLGLIVIDEEHESSFKQESTPRYHARDVALQRAQRAGVPILLGSATPSLESWHAARSAEMHLLSLPNRVEARPLPPVRLVDMKYEPKAKGMFRAIGPTLEQGLRDCLRCGGQAILMLNRRGFSTHIQCPSCAAVAQCSHCDLALTFHRGKNALLCHYCGTQTPPITHCPVCGGTAVRYQGLGTEKLHEELTNLLPGHVVQRMDSDTMGKSGSHERVLESFREGHIHVLLGTQMIAKGLDFPNVTLVGVVNAESGLHQPDFRAAERTFQLLAQVAGRAGRGEKGGYVLVQTMATDHPAIALAAKHDYLGFAAQELVVRKEHGYPPYGKLARLIVRSENAEAASQFAQQLAGSIKMAQSRAGGSPVRVLGPAECPVHKLKDHFRYHFQLQSSDASAINRVLREATAVSKPPSAVEFQIDIDPYGMM